MKSIFKTLALSALIISICLGFYAFKKYEEIKTAADVLKAILANTAYDNGSDDTEWPDSTMVKLIPASWDSTRMIKNGPQSLCNSSAAYFYRNIAASIGYTTDEGYDKKVRLNFKQAFGKDLMAPDLKIFGKDYLGKPNTMNQFKADALKAAFDKLYKKPTDDFDGFAMQRIYDAAAKSYFRSCAQVIADVMKKKPAFIQSTATYKKKAMTLKNFYGPAEGENATDKILGKDYSPNKDCMEYGADRIVGMMMRRQIDGTLPTLLICVKTVIKDYDPEFYETIKSRF